MSIIEALENALEFLETDGYARGDIHDDLSLAISRLKRKHPAVAEEEL